MRMMLLVPKSHSQTHHIRGLSNELRSTILDNWPMIENKGTE